jgi:hypothetical protein
MIDYAGIANTNGAFPIVTAKNASGAGATDGTPYIASVIDDIWGRFQAMMDRAGLPPDGITESTSNSQHIEAYKKGFAQGAGYLKAYMKNGTPVANGDRVLLLTGQGILRANYTELDAAVYVADGNNASVAAAGGAFYRADDAAGTIPNIAGIYLIMPDCRGRTLRGDDAAASVDPQGATRVLGDLQADAFQGHWHDITNGTGNILAAGGAGAFGGGGSTYSANVVESPLTDGVNGTPRTDSETRMANVQVKWAITY